MNAGRSVAAVIVLFLQLQSAESASPLGARAPPPPPPYYDWGGGHWPKIGNARLHKTVTIGYNVIYNPWKLSLYKNHFLNRTGVHINWVQMQDPRKAATALTNHEYDLAVLSSADMTRAFTRQTPVKLVWVMESLENSEGLIVHDRYHLYGSGDVETPLGLRGKRIGVLYGSTSHYSLHSYFSEFGVKIVYDTVYQRNHRCAVKPHGDRVPCHFKNQTDAVTFIGLSPEEIKVEYDAGTIHAAYIGFPQLAHMRKNGTVILTSQDLAYWDKVTFNGLVATERFLEHPGTTDFLMCFIAVIARANFYFKNNTKEFTLDYAKNDSVTYKIAATLPQGKMSDVYFHIMELGFPTIKEQASCRWLGCGATSRVAWSLKDQAEFFASLKEDHNTVLGTETPNKTTADVNKISLTNSLKDYSPFIEPGYIKFLVVANVSDKYFLQPGEVVHLGYQVTDYDGLTLSIVTPDDCNKYPRLSKDIMQQCIHGTNY